MSEDDRMDADPEQEADYPEGLDDRYDEGRDDEDCWDCGGEGYVLGDCGEDCCPCADPETQHPMVVCRTCGGKG